MLPSENLDFSENNLKNTHGFDLGHSDGGNQYMSIAYLARWNGPIREAEDPYNPYSDFSPAGLSPQRHVQEMYLLPGRIDSLDNLTIKEAVMSYGAVYTSLYWSDSYYQAVNKAYYFSGTVDTNHAVCIVGWDDTYPKTKFTAQPAGNGAFIMRNSWGAGWGESGYCYVSYYDAMIGQSNAVFYNADPLTNYNRLYEYDPLGWVSSVGYGDSNVWFANTFQAAANELVAAVSFYTSAVNTGYEIHVYRNPPDNSPVSEEGSVSDKSGILAHPGYHTIALDSQAVVSSGQKFSVVVRLVAPGDGYPCAVEMPYTGYSSQAVAGAGQSFISYDGNGWEDMTAYFPNTNACVKAFTVEDTTPPGVTLTPVSIAGWYTSDQMVAWNITDAGGVGPVQIWWDSEAPSPVSAAGSTPMREGTHIFHIRAADSAGNETSEDRTYRLDTTPPSVATTCQPAFPNGSNGWYTVLPTLTIQASDPNGSDASGLASVCYSLDSGGDAVYTAPVTIQAGIHTCCAKAADNAGNIAATPGKTIKADTTKPLFSFLKVSGTTGTVSASWLCADPQSGVSQYEYKIGSFSGGQDIVKATLTGPRSGVQIKGLNLTQERLYYFTLRSANAAGLWTDPTVFGFVPGGSNSRSPLSGPEVGPLSGNTATDFTFSIVYRPTGGQAPSSASVVITRPGSASIRKYLTTAAPATWDGSSSLYTCRTKLPAGTYTFYFEFNAGDKIYRTSGLSGPTVLSLPTLSALPVSPATGGTSTQFTFTSVYAQAQNAGPEAMTLILIKQDGTRQTHAMVTADPYYKDGSRFTYRTVLPFGSYKYYVECKGIGAVLQKGPYIGPTVR